MKTTPSFLEKYFTNEDMTKLQEKDALHTGQFKDLIFVRLAQDYKNYPRGTDFLTENRGSPI
jgi:ATP-dependent RNA circularization protein (DNA/RNA ligase family)